MFNLDEYVGLARTTYVLDGSAVNPHWVAANSLCSGTGYVSAPTALTTPGGAITLGVAEHPADAKLLVPTINFGNSANSLAAVVVEVEGISFTGLRPTARFQLVQQSSSAPKRAGILLNEMGGHAATNDTDQVETLTTAMAGNMADAADQHVGFVVDLAKKTIKGHVGYSVVDAATPLLAGSYKLEISNRTNASPTYVKHSMGVNRIKLTLIWNRPGAAMSVPLGIGGQLAYCSSVNPPQNVTIAQRAQQYVVWEATSGTPTGWTYYGGRFFLNPAVWTAQAWVTVTGVDSAAGNVEIQLRNKSGAVLATASGYLAQGKKLTLRASTTQAFTSGDGVSVHVLNQTTGSITIDNTLRASGIHCSLS